MSLQETIACKADDSHIFSVTFFPAKSEYKDVGERKSSNQSTRPVILVHPAMGIGASYYSPLVENLVSAGFNVLTVDLRGIGKSGIRASRNKDFGFLESATFDLPAAVQAAKNRCPDSPVYLLGHSLGGMINCLYASLHQEKIAGLILIASCSDYYGSWPFPRKYFNLFGMQAARVVSKVVGHYPGSIFGFGGREARRMVRDWAHQGRTGRFDVAKSDIDFERNLSNITLPILAMSFSDDEFGPRNAVRHLLIKMPKVKAVHHHLDPQELGAETMGHFGWVKQSNLVLPLIKSWFEQRT